jgi:hypothetical protein
MNDEEKILMEKYDITTMTKKVFLYKEFRYENLDNAVMYARHEAKKLASKPAESTEY